jgi:hypothetical protein
VKTAGRNGNDVAARKHHAAGIDDRRQLPAVDVSPLQPNRSEQVPGPAPTEIPLRDPTEAPTPGISNFPSTPPLRPSIPNIPPSISTDPTPTPIPTPNPNSPPLAGDQPDAATATPAQPTLANSELANAARTDLLGGAGGGVFEVISPKHLPIVGFRYRIGNWGGKSAVAKLDPLSERNAPARSDQLVIAHDGFVVGGIQVDAGDLVEAVRVVFVQRADDGTLDKTEYYFSDWIGQPTGRPVKTLGKGNVPVIGVYGRRGLVIDAIGLVLAE